MSRIRLRNKAAIDTPNMAGLAGTVSSIPITRAPEMSSLSRTTGYASGHESLALFFEPSR
jgi:hypothetical protein